MNIFGLIIEDTGAGPRVADPGVSRTTPRPLPGHASVDYVLVLPDEALVLSNCTKMCLHAG